MQTGPHLTLLVPVGLVGLRLLGKPGLAGRYEAHAACSTDPTGRVGTRGCGKNSKALGVSRSRIKGKAISFKILSELLKRWNESEGTCKLRSLGENRAFFWNWAPSSASYITLLQTNQAYFSIPGEIMWLACLRFGELFLI